MIIAFRVASVVAGVLPLRAVRRLGAWAGGLLHRRDRRARHTLERHLARVTHNDPTLVDDHVRELARAGFATYGSYLAEMAWLRPRRVAGVRARMAVTGVEHYEAGLAAGRGMIFALPHVGNWDVAGAYPQARGDRLVAVAEHLDDAAVAVWFARRRAMLGIETVTADGDRRLLARLRDVLADNGTVALVADRDVTGGGVAVTLFGESTSIPAGPATLAVLTGAALLPVVCYQTPGGHRLVIGAPLVPDPALTGRARVTELTQRLADAYAEQIAVAPDQWHVLQPQWPSDPGWRWDRP